MIKGQFTYEEAAAYIERIPKFTKKHPLWHTREFLHRLSDPAMDARIIHVAGTNGKGSVCAYLQAILMAEGKKTGFFTSPHLVSVNERIRINNQQISDERFLEIFKVVEEVAGQMEEEGLGHPSYFEFLFGMGMLTFAREKVEYIILETGLGGRLDATNAVEHPAACVITSISLDHTDILGDTIEKIAAEKAGILKKDVPVFFDGSCKKSSDVIRKTAKAVGAPCREISKNAYEIREVDWKHIAFSRVNAYDKDVIYEIPLCGCYQAMNVELALETVEYLMEAAGRKKEIKERSRVWAKALAGISWEGRMERIGDHMILDGAHNPGAIAAFAESVREAEKSAAVSQEMLGAELAEEAPVVVFSAVADKKYEEMIQDLCTQIPARCYVVTEIEDKRRVPAEELKAVFERYTDRPVLERKELKDALRTAEQNRSKEGKIYCLGSLYLVGMVKKLLAGGGNHAEF